MSTAVKLVVFGVCLAVHTAICAAEECADSEKRDIRRPIKTHCFRLDWDLSQEDMKLACDSDSDRITTTCCKTCAKIQETPTPYTEDCKDTSRNFIKIPKTMNCAEYYEWFKKKMPAQCKRNSLNLRTKCCATCKRLTAPPAEQEVNIIGHRTEQMIYSRYKSRDTSKLAVDGDEASCSKTEVLLNSWWSVYLVDDVNVTKVEMISKGDCCPNIEVWVTKGKYSRSTARLHCGTLAKVNGTSWVTVACTTPTKGRYVTIRLAEKNALQLCEVKVFGIIVKERQGW